MNMVFAVSRDLTRYCGITLTRTYSPPPQYGGAMMYAQTCRSLSGLV